jgi:hypothetical protein
MLCNQFVKVKLDWQALEKSYRMNDRVPPCDQMTVRVI